MSTKIEWTDETWNPTTGCTKISEGCRHCYIDRTPPFRINHRSFDKGEEIGATTGVLLHPDRLDHPLHWKKPRRVFVNSLSDLFHEDIPTAFIAEVFATMALTPQHTYQILTKRPRRMRDLLSDGDRWAELIDDAITLSSLPDDVLYELPLPNVWLGTSVEDQKAADLRIPLLLQTPAAVRFLSCEPLLGSVDLRGGLGFEYDFDDPRTQSVVKVPVPAVDWVIVGGESGLKARPMHPAWARSLRDQCVDAGVPFFFKQWGQWVGAGGRPNDLPREAITFDGRRFPYRHGEGIPAAATLDTACMVRLKNKHDAGRVLDGRTWDEFPEAVSV